MTAEDDIQERIRMEKSLFQVYIRRPLTATCK